MVKEIKDLTPEQRTMMPAWRDKWIEIGLSTEPADRKQAEAAYRACYRAANLRDDVPIIWVSSPIVGATAALIATNLLSTLQKSELEAVADEVQNALSEVHSALGPAVVDAMHAAVATEVLAAVNGAVAGVERAAVGGMAHREVRNVVSHAVHGAVDDAVHNAVHGAVRGVVEGAVHNAARGVVANDAAMREAEIK